MNIENIVQNNEEKLKKITVHNRIIETLQKQIKDLNKSIYSLISNMPIENEKSKNNKKNYLEQQIEKLMKENDELVYENENLKKKVNMYDKMFYDPDIDKKHDVMCILCESNTRNVLFRPCNHLVICDNCSGSTDFRECIICKQAIESYEYAYLV